MRLSERLKRLEGASRRRWNKVHEVIWRHSEGQTEAEAFDAYGRDRIGPNDFTIVRKICAPGKV